MKTINIVLPPNLRFGGTYEKLPVIAFARFLARAGADAGYSVLTYGPEAVQPEPKYIALIDTAMRYRLNSTTEEWPPAAQCTPELTAAYNKKATEQVRRRLGSDNYILLFGGINQKPIADAIGNANNIYVHAEKLPSSYMLSLYPSYSGMNLSYGQRHGDGINRAGGQYFDSVVYYSPPHSVGLQQTRENFLLYEVNQTDGQLVKMISEAVRIEAVGIDRYTLDTDQYYYFVSRAKCFIAAPTMIDVLGIEIIEALSCGTPVVTVDWGISTELIIQGLNGYRCRNIGEYIHAISNLGDLNPTTIKYHFNQKLDYDIAKTKFEDFLKQVADIWGEGFYSRRTPSGKRYN